MTVLRMTSLTKRNGSDNWYYRRVIPVDIQGILGKLPSSAKPKGWHKTDIFISTGTPDRKLARAKAADIAADVESQFKALRDGPKPLTIKQVSALSGHLYRSFAEGLENNPGLTSEQWLRVAAENEATAAGKLRLKGLGIGQTSDDLRTIDMEDRFGSLVDATLKHHRIITTDASRWHLIETVARDLTAGVKKLARNADGDFTPDTYAARFPPSTEIAVSTVATAKSITELAEAWHTAALARQVRPRDAKRMKSVVVRFQVWLEHDELHRVTPEDVQAWGDERNNAGIQPKTINDTDFTALRAIFKWGKSRKWLATNPAEDARIEGRGKTTTREKWFRDDEIADVLNAAMAAKGSTKQKPKTTAAIRWIPWLLAYSGARVVEMIQLRKEDIRYEHGGWVIRITPDAGDVKTNEYRDVPVHEHLVALGFIAFVQESKPGHIFFDIGKDGNTEGPVSGIYDRVRKAVRLVVSDTNLQPNHAWRYTFKTYGHDAGLDNLTIDAICGHAAKTQGELYRGVTIRKRLEVMAQFPRYNLEASKPRTSG